MEIVPAGGSRLSLGGAVPDKEGGGEGVLRLPPAVPALANVHRVREPGSEVRAFIGLDRNERVGPLPEWFLAIIRDALESMVLTAYPAQDELCRQLARHLGAPEERLLVTAGADAAVRAIYHAYVRPGDGVVMLDPTYAMYEVYARIFQARAARIPFSDALEVDAESLLDSVTDGVRLVILANPNQPTGTLLDEAVLLDLLERTRRAGALLAVDEAYYPFSRTTVQPWIDWAPHLLVIRTLSKAAGLAGLRIGYVVGHPDVVANLYKVRTAHDINSVAILCASQVLKHPQIMDDYVAQVEAGAQLLTERARALGLTPLPTHANFLLIRVGHRYPPWQVVAALRDHGYLVKGPFDVPCLADCIRVTLGPPGLMSAFADALERVLSGVAAEPLQR